MRSGRLPYGLFAVAAGYVVWLVVGIGLDRPAESDEFTYITQINSELPALNFGPQRARGLTFVIAPLSWFNVSMETMHLFMTLLTAAGLAAAFLAWRRHLGTTTVTVAAALFAGSWLTQFYGSEVMPHVIVGLLAVAATGIALDGGRGRRRAIGLAMLGALAALIRPTDVLLLGAGALGAIVVTRTWRLLRSSWPAIAGVAAGTAAWGIELAVRFSRTELSQRVDEHVGGESGVSVSDWLSTVWGAHKDVRRVDVPPPSPWLFAALALAGVALGVAFIGARRQQRAIPLTVAAVAAGTAIASHVVLAVQPIPRFLIPALALASLPVAEGLVRAARHAAGAAVVASLVIAWVVFQSAVAVETSADQRRAGALPERAGLAIRAEARGEPCVAFADRRTPVIEYWSGCRVRFGTSAETDRLLHVARRWKLRPFLVVSDRSRPAPGWIPIGEPIGRIVIYEPA